MYRTSPLKNKLPFVWELAATQQYRKCEYYYVVLFIQAADLIHTHNRKSKFVSSNRHTGKGENIHLHNFYQPRFSSQTLEIEKDKLRLYSVSNVYFISLAGHFNPIVAKWQKMFMHNYLNMKHFAPSLY